MSSVAEQAGSREAARPNPYAGVPGQVYLLHFARPFRYGGGRVQHYLGWTHKLRQRLRDHRAGRGSAVTRAACRQGVPFVLARTWSGTTDQEAALRRLGPVNLCPVCQALDPAHLVELRRAEGA